MGIATRIHARKMDYRLAGLPTRLGVHRNQLSLYIHGKSTPSLDIAIRILRETKGKVTVEDLANPTRQ